MSVENRISISIPAELLTQASGLINQLKTLFQPFVVALSGEEIQSLFKMSDKSISFVEKCIFYAKNNASYLPPFVDMPELEKDFKAVSDLFSVLRPLQELEKSLSDSAVLAGSEAIVSSAAIYNTVKQADKMNVPGAKAAYDDLKKRFVRKSPPDEPGLPPQS